jgi:hypothetical protein
MAGVFFVRFRRQPVNRLPPACIEAAAPVQLAGGIRAGAGR